MGQDPGTEIPAVNVHAVGGAFDQALALLRNSRTPLSPSPAAQLAPGNWTQHQPPFPTNANLASSASAPALSTSPTRRNSKHKLLSPLDASATKTPATLQKQRKSIDEFMNEGLMLNLAHSAELPSPIYHQRRRQSSLCASPSPNTPPGEITSSAGTSPRPRLSSRDHLSIDSRTPKGEKSSKPSSYRRSSYAAGVQDRSVQHLVQKLSSAENALRISEKKLEHVQHDADVQHRVFWEQSRKMRDLERKMKELQQQKGWNIHVDDEKSRQKPRTAQVGSADLLPAEDSVEAALWYERFCQLKEAYILSLKAGSTLAEALRKETEFDPLDASFQDVLGEDMQVSDLAIKPEDAQYIHTARVAEAFQLQRILEINKGLLVKVHRLEDELRARDKTIDEGIQRVTNLEGELEFLKAQIALTLSRGDPATAQPTRKYGGDGIHLEMPKTFGSAAFEDNYDYDAAIAELSKTIEDAEQELVHEDEETRQSFQEALGAMQAIFHSCLTAEGPEKGERPEKKAIFSKSFKNMSRTRKGAELLRHAASILVRPRDVGIQFPEP